MPRATNADIAVFNLGSDLLAYLKSADFGWDMTLVACAGIANRFEPMLETKRAFTFSAQMNRKANDAGACMTAKSVTTLSLGGTSRLASWESYDIGYQNANSRSDAGGDTLAQVQLHRPTSVSGSMTMMVDQATATLLTDYITAGTSVAVTWSEIDAVGTTTIATFIKSIKKSWPESGIIMLTVSVEGGTISSGGGGLFATGATGTGEVNFSASDGADPIEGTAVILSGRRTVARDGRTSEAYEFHTNSIAVSS
jgi:hypothetical protein